MTDQARTEQTKAPRPDARELIRQADLFVRGDHHDPYRALAQASELLEAFIEAASPPLSGEVEELVASGKPCRWCGAAKHEDHWHTCAVGKLAAALSSEHRGRVALEAEIQKMREAE